MKENSYVLKENKKESDVLAVCPKSLPFPHPEKIYNDNSVKSKVQSSQRKKKSAFMLKLSSE